MAIDAYCIYAIDNQAGWAGDARVAPTYWLENQGGGLFEAGGIAGDEVGPGGAGGFAGRAGWRGAAE